MEKFVFEDLVKVDVYLSNLQITNGVVFVAAIEGNLDYGNYFVFLNGDDFAHVMLHEHHEFYPKDPKFDSEVESQKFMCEDGSSFNVEPSRLTSKKRAMQSLEFWLPKQEKWNEYIW